MSASKPSAMRSFVEWASAQPFRLILLTIVSFYLLAPVSPALVVVAGLRHGPVMALTTALIAMAVVITIGMLAGVSLIDNLSVAAPILIGGAVSGALLSWSRSLSLAFQGTVVGCIVGVLIVFAAFVDTSQLESMLQNEVLALYEQWGATVVQLEQVRAIDPGEFVWALLALLLVVVLAGLMLGYWWYALIDDRVTFGSDFRALQLGKVTGILSIALVVAFLFTDWTLVRYVAPMAVIGFLFQGLAVLHARSFSDNWPRMILVIVYCLFIPLADYALVALSAIGLLDNFFELRTRAKPQE